MLRSGPIQRHVQVLAGTKNDNVLKAFRELDNRHVPDSEEDREDAKDMYIMIGVRTCRKRSLLIFFWLNRKCTV